MKQYNTNCNSVKEYFDNIKSYIGEDNLNDLISNDFVDDDGLFLSVVMRTQGKRISPLQEVLLCLQAQTVDNFEVLLLGHNVAEEDKVNVLELVESFPDEFKSRVTYFDVKGGTRTTPLNFGFEKAKGQYITILDDDDLVFDNWVETFYDLYQKCPGKILHAYAVGQEWQMINSKPVSLSSFNNLYCRDFIMNNQLSVNNCPIMSLAFPAYSFKKFNIRFNEKLTTTEDWDFLMRTAFFCGVCDSDNPTSVYRFWKNLQNSQALHNEDEWKNNYKYIQNNFKKFFIPTQISDILNSSNTVALIPSETSASTSEIEVFIDNGNGFNCGNKAKFESGFEGADFKIELLNPQKLGIIKNLRFDPSDFGFIKLTNFKVYATDAEKKPIKTKIDFVSSNFVKYKGKYLFLEDDPQIKINFKKATICSTISFVFNIEKHLSWKLISYISFKLFFVKIIRKVLLLGKRIFR